MNPGEPKNHFKVFMGSGGQALMGAGSIAVSGRQLPLSSLVVVIASLIS